jgi:hypothetical protein
MKNAFLALLAGLSLLILSYLGLHHPDTILSTGPLFLLFGEVLASLLVHESWPVIQATHVVLPALLFFAWNPGLLRGQVGTPKRTYVLVPLGVALCVAYFVDAWSGGVEYQGLKYTRFVCAENGVWIAILCVLYFRSWKGEPSFITNLALHWAFFAWIALYAFPFLGSPI